MSELTDVNGGFGHKGWLDLRSRALSPALIEARLQALQARIRPHFLFNSLTAVLSLIRADPRRAEQVLEDLADLFRALMADSRTLSTLEREPLRDALDIVKAFRLWLRQHFHLDTL